MAYWVDSEGKRHNVKNLGWLLRHWSRVESFEVYPRTSGSVEAFELWDDRHGKSNLILCANLKGGGYYATNYACLSVLLAFLDRPNFRGLKVTFKVPVLTSHPVNMLIQLGDVVLDVGSEDYRGLPERS